MESIPFGITFLDFYRLRGSIKKDFYESDYLFYYVGFFGDCVFVFGFWFKAFIANNSLHYDWLRAHLAHKLVGIVWIANVYEWLANAEPLTS